MNTGKPPPKYHYEDGHVYILLSEVPELIARCTDMDARSRADLPLIVEGGIGSTHLGKLARPVA